MEGQLTLLRIVLAGAGGLTVLAVVLAPQVGLGDSQIGPLERVALCEAGVLFAAAGLARTRWFRQQWSRPRARWRLGLGLVALMALAMPAIVVPSPEFILDPARMWRYVTVPGLVGVLAFILSVSPRLARIQLFVCLGLLGLIELTVRGLESISTGQASTGGSVPVTTEGSYYSGYFEYDPLLGFRGRPNRQSRSVRRQGDRVIYDVHYTVGANGFRVTPQSSSEQKGRLVVFFGDSFTIGEGVNDNETLPAQYAAQANEVRVANLGFHGYGPQQMLALLEAPQKAGIEHQGRAAAVYVYQSSHLMRLKGSLQVQAWGHHMPRYVLAPDGKVELAGNFTTGRPLFAALYPLLARSHVLKRLKFDPWSRIAPDDRDLAVVVFAEACRRFASRFESEGCYILFYPGSGDEAQSLIPALREVGIGVVDLSAAWGPSEDAAFRIEGDGHANALGHADIARRLAHALAGLFDRP